MEPTRSGGFWPSDQAEVIEDLAGHERNVADLRPGHARNRVEVDPQLIRMIEVRRPHRMGIEVDAAEVDDPGELRGVTHHDLLGGAAGWKGERDGFNPVGARRGSALLEEGFAFGPV